MSPIVQRAKHAAAMFLRERGFTVRRDADHLFRALRSLDIVTVIDVGANTGQFGSDLRAHGYTGDILSFEPGSDAFAALSARVASDRRWSATRAALGRTSGTLELHIAANSVSSSLLSMTDTHLDIAPESHYVATESVAVHALDEVLAERSDLDLTRTLLKVDTQGYESEVLAGAATAMARLRAVQLELSFTAIYEGQELFGALSERMTAAGFDLWWVEPGHSDPTTGRWIWADGLFVRR